ncbi:ABC transport system permease protein [Cupriavidus necator]|uniref:ABC transport system permease protein n=1 Tax=Cupriavidus necator TaxID=106590 RepID=A0A1K0JA18_CUPNE|nr:ABC transport system permease protein [Cupriavidus necator]
MKPSLMPAASTRMATRVAVLALAALAPLAAHAHRQWLLPSATVLSGSDPWVTVDAAVSNDLFYFEHVPMRLDNLQVTAPDGSAVKAENAATGKYRSTFDLHLTQPGTYRVAVVNNGLFASYKVDGQAKRWRGTAENFAREVPASAQDLQVTQAEGRIESFVSAGKPSDKGLRTAGRGLELAPITHPNDLVAGDTASFRMLLDGKPASNLKVSVVPGGIRYRDQLQEFSATTDADGKFSIKWPAAGMYWMEAEVKDDKATFKQARSRRAVYAVTVEVLPQ